MPAPNRTAKPRDDKKHKPFGDAGILITPSFTAWTGVHRKPSPNRNGRICPRRLTNFPGISRKTSSGRKALISLALWAHFWCAAQKTSSGLMLLIQLEFPAHFP